MITCSIRARPRNPDPGDCRSADRAGPGGRNGQRRFRCGPQKADAHRHGCTTDDRNWELRYTQFARRLSLSRAVGIDMESATIAAQGYRFRVPYGTLLCVSDKPLHGEIKLPGQANRFYEEAIAAHLKIGTTACDLLRAEGAAAAQPQAACL
jgi:AMP nucleosidase